MQDTSVIEASTPPSIPHQSLAAVFLRFLRFGCLAFGGPVAQIGMLQRELVERERWISMERFQRALSVYQLLPGPEAHELCVYFGMLARGRWGGFLAGLGFMLPGFALMLLASWLYVSTGGAFTHEWRPVFLALQAAVLALIVRAVQRIGAHAIHDRRLQEIAIVSLLGSLCGVHFAIQLCAAALLYWFSSKERRPASAVVFVLWAACIVYALFSTETPSQPVGAGVTAAAPIAKLFLSGLKSGLLTFGGAYTAIPFLRDDAVVRGGWMTDAQFLDGIALGGILPAPLVIFATFVGYVGGGLGGALVMTCGMFLPAFGFTLLAHEFFERVTNSAQVRVALTGVMAAVVGLIAATAIRLAPVALGSVGAWIVFALALAVLFRVKNRWSVLIVVFGAGLIGKVCF